MFLASALVLPVGMSYALPANVTASTPSVQTMTNQTSTNQTSTTNPGMNNTSTNQTSTMNPGMNQTKAPTNSTVSPPMETPKIMTPLKQVKSGVAPKDVQCKQGYTLILKAEDGSPACVDPTVAQVLLQRGW